MRRRLLTIVLLLVAGAVATVGIPEVLPEILPWQVLNWIDPTIRFKGSPDPRAIWDKHARDGWPEPTYSFVQRGPLSTMYVIGVF